MKTIFFLALPVPEIERLGPSTEAIESCGFAAKYKSIFNARRKALVVSRIEGLIVVTRKGGVLIEFHVITSNMVVVLH
jgi:hypothetical protein